MKYAIISDIHSNIEALEVVLAEIKNIKVDSILCLGDVVGYNANPNECIDLLKENNISTVMGNHDLRAINYAPTTHFNQHAKYSIEWTQSILTKDSIDFLKSLPPTLTVDNKILLIHGWIKSTDDYIFSVSEARINLDILGIENDEKICFFGHTHVPIIYSEDSKENIISSPIESNTLKSKEHYLINPGSVGQPRDKDNRASFAVIEFDNDKIELKLHRVAYDIKKTIMSINDAGLPKILGDRLLVGK